MKYPTSILLSGIIFLSACSSTPSAEHGGHTGNAANTSNLLIRDQSTETEIAFSVADKDGLFDDYGVSHTKEMHLIVVRDDLQHFQHLHPERDAAGVWRVPFTLADAGTYWIYADFVDADQRPYTIRFDKRYPGDPAPYGIAKNAETTAETDGYRFVFRPAVSGNDVTFAYDITDEQGRPAELEEYLGAKGHSVLISPSGDFIHTHASDDGGAPVFGTTLPPDEFYRAFTQFQIGGKIVTVRFDWTSPVR